jgi:Ca2+/Na+ antiporter
MKTGGSDIQKFLVLSLLVMYLFIVVIYLFYLPKYSSLRAVNYYNHTHNQLTLTPKHHVDHSSDNILVLLHRTYRSTVENKRDVRSSLFQTAIILISLFTSSIILLNLFRKKSRYFNLSHYSHQYAYLNYCSLRI